MNVKEAVQAAKEYVADLYADEPVRHIGVEEVTFDEQDDAWKVTIGFFRPWDEKLGMSEILRASAEDRPAHWRKRTFKVAEIDDHSGKVRSLTHRSLPSAI